jgi:peptidoglycan/LPS O-acetylase OafA/YrhL
MYLIHVPIIGLLLGLQTRLAVRSPARSALVSFALLIAIYGVTILAGYVLHVLVEVPCINLSRRLKPRERTHSRGAVLRPDESAMTLEPIPELLNNPA